MNYAYDGVKYSMNSTVNQRVRDRFINRGVIYGANQLIQFLQEKEHYEEIEDLYGQEVWDEEVAHYLQQLMDEDQEEVDNMHKDDQPDFFGYIDEIAEEYNLDCVLNKEFCAEDIVEEIKADGELENFGRDRDITPEYREPYEFWIVTEWFARKLKGQGEIIADDVLGFTIWGRCTTGQALSMDGVIATICFNENILEGQKYYQEV